MSGSLKASSLAALSAVAAVGVSLLTSVPALGAAINTSASLPASATGTVTWSTTTAWTTNPDYPSGNAAIATINGPSAARTLPMAAAITSAGLILINDTSFKTTTQNGAGGGMTFDTAANAGVGPVNIDVSGSGTGNFELGTTTTFTDSVVVNVTQTTASSSDGGFIMSATTLISPGGFTKTGPGTMSLKDAQKRWQGATLLDTNSGRTNINQAAAFINTPSFTVNSGAQLSPLNAGTYNLGTGNLNLNGTGIAAFPGVIRQSTGIAVVIPSPVVLQSDSTLHVQATAGTGATATPTGSLTLSGAISGPGGLRLTAINSNVDQGFLILSNNNSYAGGTLVAGGILEVSGAASDLGTGNVVVDSSSTSGAIARLQIDLGVLNAIDDAAMLTLAGGGTPAVADQNFAILNYTGTDTVGALVLGATSMPPGVYGSSTSSALPGFQFDEYFSGPGTITVTPEPAAFSLLALGGLGLLGRRRRSL